MPDSGDMVVFGRRGETVAPTEADDGGTRRRAVAGGIVAARRTRAARAA